MALEERGSLQSIAQQHCVHNNSDDGTWYGESSKLSIFKNLGNQKPRTTRAEAEAFQAVINGPAFTQEDVDRVAAEQGISKDSTRVKILKVVAAEKAAKTKQTIENTGNVTETVKSLGGFFGFGKG